MVALASELKDRPSLHRRAAAVSAPVLVTKSKRPREVQVSFVACHIKGIAFRGIAPRDA